MTTTIRWKSFGKAVKAARKKHNLSTRTFEKSVGIDHVTVYRVELGGRTTVETYFALCMACELDPWSYIEQTRP